MPAVSPCIKLPHFVASYIKGFSRFHFHRHLTAMAKKKTQLKIVSSGRRKRQEILAAVAKIEGVEKLEMDVTKSVLTVIGEVEPVPIFMALKKICVKSEIMTVGPTKPEKPNEQQQQQTWRYGPAPSCSYCCNSYCKQCELIGIAHPFTADTGQCSIL